jgi:hypothetical protein
MFIAMIPLFILIALAAFILQVLEFDTEMENAVAFVEQTNNLEAKFVSLKSRAIQTTDIGNLDRIHEQVGNASIYWNATQKWVRCNKNESAAGTHHYLPHKKHCYHCYHCSLFEIQQLEIIYWINALQE